MLRFQASAPVRRRCSAKTVTASVVTTSASQLIFSLRHYEHYHKSRGQEYFGQDVRGETERQGPQRVPFKTKDGRFIDPTIRDPEETRKSFEKENAKIQSEMSKMHGQYGGGGGAAARPDPTMSEEDFEAAAGGAGSGSGSGRVGGFVDPPEFSYTPEDDSNPYGAGNQAHSREQLQQGLSGSLQDRENIRVRGQKPPPDFPMTDEEVDAHPAAKRLRFIGFCGCTFILYVMWKVFTDPFNEGERYTRWRQAPDGSMRPALPYEPNAINELREHKNTYGKLRTGISAVQKGYKGEIAG